MSNPYNQFQSLVQRDSLDVVTVVTLNGDGTSQCLTLGGATVTIKGDSVGTGLKAYIRGGEIVRQAPDLTITEVSI